METRIIVILVLLFILLFIITWFIICWHCHEIKHQLDCLNAHYDTREEIREQAKVTNERLDNLTNSFTTLGETISKPIAESTGDVEC